MKQLKEGIFISQEGYAKEVLEKFKVVDCKLVNTSKLENKEKGKSHSFQGLVRSLRYLTCTMPNTFYVVVVVSLSIETPASTYM